MMQNLIKGAIHLLWQINTLIAGLFLGILMRQKLPLNHVDKLFLQCIRDIAHSVIYSKITGSRINCKEVYSEIMQEVFNSTIGIKAAAAVKIAWVRPSWPLVYLAGALKPFEYFSLIHFFIKMIEIPNGDDTSLKKIFQLAFNIGQFIGNCQWYTSGIVLFLVCYLRMQLRWYHSKESDLSNDHYLYLVLHISGILDRHISY